MSWSSSNALRLIRLAHNLSLQEFAERLTISKSHVRQIESQRKSPTEMLLKLASLEFGVNLKWLQTGEGRPSQDDEMNRQIDTFLSRESLQKRIVITSAVLVPFLPVAAASLAAGVGVEEVLDRMRRAYGAKSMAELAAKFLKTPASALSRWKSEGRIPQKYLDQVPEDTGKPLEYFFVKEEQTDAVRKELLDFILELIYDDRENRMDLAEIQRRFDDKFPKQFSQ